MSRMAASPRLTMAMRLNTEQAPKGSFKTERGLPRAGVPASNLCSYRPVLDR
jgi:hypothetical protein